MPDTAAAAVPKKLSERLYISSIASFTNRIHIQCFVADGDLRGQNVLPLIYLLQEVLKVPRE